MQTNTGSYSCGAFAAVCLTCCCGHALMDFAKQQAKELGCRVLILETQSCNETAIAFYLAQGLTFFGFDRCCYGNRDVENREMRLELGCYM